MYVCMTLIQTLFTSLNATYIQNADLKVFVSVKKMFRSVSPRFAKNLHCWVPPVGVYGFYGGVLHWLVNDQTDK